jgi:glycyl-tRNA synthetase beta chain
MVNKNTKNALLEIGAEEIPSSYIDQALKQMEQIATKTFNSVGLKYGAMKTYGTPRRLVLMLENLAENSDDKKEEILGPSLKAAKDAQGKFTQAATGFATKCGVAPKELIVKATKKGEYLSFIKKTKGDKTQNLLTIIFPEIIKGISFPKAMTWEESGFKFARPIRNIVALYGKKIIKFKIADVTSSNWTIGLHTYDSSKIKIDLPENYIATMRNKSTLVCQKERRDKMKRSIESVVENVGSVIFDEELIYEVNYLVEYPSAVLCAFDKKYLDLPKEALAVCIKKSQKCFAINDKTGKFSNYFIGIKNGISAYQEIAKEGYERVVAARLADAQFFYRNDLKTNVLANVEKLKGIVFHKEIGTVYEKIERIKQVATLFNRKFCMQIDNALLEKAIMFSKADLASEMVFEYPQLQGIMGKIYALKLGESLEFAESIEQHYYPLNASGALPSNKIALLISLADKIDTLAANFSIGLEPSGSADPYGLRRCGIGFIRIVMENLPNQDLSEIVAEVFEFLPENVKNNPKAKNAYERLIDFLWQKIEGVLQAQGYSPYEVKAVINEAKVYKLKALGSLRPKLIALQNAVKKDAFISTIAIFKRINNIINQAKQQNINILQQVNESLLSTNAEQVLFALAKQTKMEIANYISKNDYDKVFDKILEMKPTVESFFGEVMVMAEDESVKLNRIALLNYARGIFTGFIDFSALGQS